VTVATAIFGGLTPFLAELLIRQTGWSALPGAMIAAVALAVLPVLLTMPETRPSLLRARRRERVRQSGDH
jgi:MHS family proline/betaine transporter-like MFS transporter